MDTQLVSVELSSHLTVTFSKYQHHHLFSC